MTFLKVLEEPETTGEVAEIYRKEREELGYVMAATRAWTTRPELLPAWGRFIGTVRGGAEISPRDWRLITLIAAKRIRSTYCSLVYGKQLIADLGSPERVLAVQRDFRTAGLEPRDVAMLEYAEKICDDAPSIVEADVQRLREHGFSDHQIMDIALCASIRNLASRFYDAVGATADEELLALDPAFRDPLTVGRALSPSGDPAEGPEPRRRP